MSYESYKEILEELKDQSVEMSWYKSISDEDEILLSKEFMSQVKAKGSSKVIGLISLNKSMGFDNLNDSGLAEIYEQLDTSVEWVDAQNESSWLFNVLLKIDAYAEDLKEEILYETHDNFLNYSTQASNYNLEVYYKNFEHVCWFNDIVQSLSGLLENKGQYCIKVLKSLLYQKLHN